MAWLSAFKGLKKLGVPPVLVVVLLGAFFVYTRVTGSDSDAAAPSTA